MPSRDIPTNIKYIVVDVETHDWKNGGPRDGRIVEIAWMVFDRDMKCIESKQYLLKPHEYDKITQNDAQAIFILGCFYRDGLYGFEQDYTKALELLHRAGDLRNVNAYNNIGQAYETGKGVEIDMKKTQYYTELAAMRGDAYSRQNLGIHEEKDGNLDRALKHYMIAVRSGKTESLKIIKELYSNGHAIKDDYTKALRSYQEYLVEIKSCQSRIKLLRQMKSIGIINFNYNGIILFLYIQSNF